MMKLIIVVFVLNLGLFSCLSTSQKNESAANDNRNSTSSPDNQANSKATSIQEPSIDEMVKAVPPDILKQSDCSIEEDVTITPESGGRAPLKVTFDARASKAPCGKIVKWAWGFGDGAKAKGVKVKHTYTAPGTYVVTLSMTDNKGNTNLIKLEHVVPITDARSLQPDGKPPQGLNQRLKL